MGFIVGNATVITVDKQRSIINDGAVAVNGTLIEAVGKTDEIKAQYPDYEFHDMSGRIVMPGLITATCI